LCIQAFRYLRPVISIDVLFLRERYGGRFLVAVRYDAENQLLPLASGLVEKENISNWGWFMRWPRHEVVGDDRRICVISDQHLTIKAVFQSPIYGWDEESGLAVHRLCVQYIAENILKMCQNKIIVSKFKKACRKNSPWKLKTYLDEVEGWSKDGRAYLNSIGTKCDTDPNAEWAPHMWSLCHDKGNRWGMIMTSDGSESLHKVFKEACGLLVCALVEASYYKLLEWFNKRRLLARELASTEQIFSNRVADILEKRANKVMRHEVQITNLDECVYEVIAKYECVTKHGRQDRSYRVVVNPGQKLKCKCRKSHNTYIACSHVLAVCAARNYDPNEFTNYYYTISAL
jgi:MULE transposase domain